MDVVSTLSSQSVVIEYNGTEVGACQSLTIQSNYNVNRVTNLWAKADQAFVRGTPQYTISATKAFIELTTFFGGLKAVTDLKNNAIKVKQLQENGTRGLLLSDVASMLGSTGNALTQLFTGAQPADNFFSNIYFDIKVKAPSFQGLSIGKALDNEIWILSGCKIVARQISIDVNSILMLEKVDILAKELTDVFLRDYSAS